MLEDVLKISEETGKEEEEKDGGNRMSSQRLTDPIASFKNV